MVCNAVCSSNTEFAMPTVPAATSTDSVSSQVTNHLSTYFISAVCSSKMAVPVNAFFPMLVTLFGMVISVRFVQF